MVTYSYLHRVLFRLIHSSFLGLNTYMNILSHSVISDWLFSFHLYYSFHDGSLNFYRPDTTGLYTGSTITGLNSPKVSGDLRAESYISDLRCWSFPIYISCHGQSSTAQMSMFQLKHVRFNG